MALKLSEIVYGDSYSMKSGFYKGRVGLALETEKLEGSPPRVKLRVTGTIYTNKQFDPGLVVDVWVLLSDIEGVVSAQP